MSRMRDLVRELKAVRTEYDCTVGTRLKVSMAEQMAAAFRATPEARDKMIADARKVASSLPNGPATAESVSAAEVALEFSFPSDYREFLLMHDGWPRFSGEYALLSTSELVEPEWRASIDAVAAAYATDGDDAPARGVVIYASLGGRQLGFFDRAGARDTGPELVFYDLGEAIRHASFTQYLESMIATGRRALAKN